MKFVALQNSHTEKHAAKSAALPQREKPKNTFYDLHKMFSFCKVESEKQSIVRHLRSVTMAW